MLVDSFRHVQNPVRVRGMSHGPTESLWSCYKMSHGAGAAGHAQSPQTGVMKYQLFKASFSLQAGY